MKKFKTNLQHWSFRAIQCIQYWALHEAHPITATVTMLIERDKSAFAYHIENTFMKVWKAIKNSWSPCGSIVTRSYDLDFS